MDLAVFFHAWTGGGDTWREPTAEFVAALGDYPSIVRLGHIGTPAGMGEFAATVPRSMIVAHADTGYESVTLNAVRRYAQRHVGAVLYAHTKGASNPEPFRARWRRSMLRRVVEPWRDNLALLESGDVDAVGCHWLTEAEYPGMFGAMTVPAQGSGFFGGNFWMATCEYLRTLPVCESEPRWRAEQWIGIGRPRVVDLLPGWPQDNRWPELCE